VQWIQWEMSHDHPRPTITPLLPQEMTSEALEAFLRCTLKFQGHHSHYYWEASGDVFPLPTPPTQACALNFWYPLQVWRVPKTTLSFNNSLEELTKKAYRWKSAKAGPESGNFRHPLPMESRTVITSPGHCVKTPTYYYQLGEAHLRLSVQSFYQNSITHCPCGCFSLSNHSRDQVDTFHL